MSRGKKKTKILKKSDRIVGIPRNKTPWSSAGGISFKADSSAGFSKQCLDIVQTIVFAADSGGRIIMINRGGCEALGYDEKELIGESWYDFISEDFQSDVKKRFRTLLSGEAQSLEYCEYPLVSKSGEERLIAWQMASSSDSNGDVTGILGSGLDITEDQQILVDKRQTVQYLESIIKASPLAIISVDLEGHVISWSRAAENMFGWSEKEVIGRFNPIIPKNAREEFLGILEDTSNIKTVLGKETRRVRKDGIYIDISVSTAPLRDNDGEIIGTIGILEDISDRVLAQSELHVSQARLAEAEHIAGIGTIDVDIDTGESIWSDNVYLILGIKPRSIRPSQEALFGYVHPDYRKSLRKTFEKHSRHGGEFSAEYRILKQTGEERIIAGRGSVLEDKDGRPSRLISTIQDITSQKELEFALKKNEEQFRFLVQHTHDIITVLDEKSTIEYEGPAIWNLLGYRPDELIGKSAFEFVHPDDQKAAIKTIRQGFENPGQIQSQIFRFRHKDGSWRILSSIGSIHDWGGGRLRAVISSRDITASRQADEKLREQTRWNEQILETMNDGFVLADIDDRIIGVNQAYCDMVGYSRNELLSMNLMDLDKQYDFDSDSGVHNSGDGNGHRRLETRHHKKDGSIIDIEVSTVRIKPEDTALSASFIRDITVKKRTEEALRDSEKRHRQVIENAVEMIFTTDIKGNYVYANPAVQRLSGYSLKELRRMNYQDLIIPEHRKRVKRHYIKQYLKKDPASHIQYAFKSKNGDIVWFSQNASLIMEDGEVTGFHIISRDITEQVNAEREINNLARFPNENPGPVLRVSNNAILLYANKSSGELLDLWRCDIGKPLPDSIKSIVDEINSDGSIRNIEVEAGERVFSLVCTPIVEAGYINVYGMDVTRRKTAEKELRNHKEHLEELVQERSAEIIRTNEKLRAEIEVRRRAEKALSESEARYHELFVTVMEGLGSVDENENIIFCNPAFARIFGFDLPEEIIGRNLMDFIPERNHQMIRTESEKRARGVSSQYELEIITAAKLSRTILASISPRLKDGRYVGTFGAILDITQRKQAEKALVMAKAQLEHLMLATPAVIYSCESSGAYPATFISPNIKQLLDYEPNDFISDPNFWAGNIHPDDRETVFSGLDGLLERGHHTHEYRFRHKKGHYIWMRDELAVIRDENGEPLELAGYWIEITERKEMEESLKKSGKLLTEAQRIAHFGNWNWEVQGNELYWSDEVYRILGFRPQEFKPSFEKFISLIHDDDREMVQKAVNESLYGGKPYGLEFRMMLPNQTIRVTYGRGEVYYDSDGKPLMMLGTIHDITDSKKIEEELRKHRDHLENLVQERTAEIISANEQLRREIGERIRIEEAIRKNEKSLAEAQRIAHLGNWEWYPKTNELTISDELYRMLGLNPNSTRFNLESYISYVHPDDKEGFVRAASNIADGHSFEGIEYRLVRKNGDVMIVQAQGEIVEHEDGKPVVVIGTLLDTTERKKAEIALRESESKYRSLIEQSNDGIFLVVENKIELVNRRFCEMLAVSENDILSDKFDFWEFIAPSSIEQVKSMINDAKTGANQPSGLIELTILNKSGREIDIQASMTFILYEGRKAMQGILHDVTERKKLEDQLRQSQKMEGIGRLAGGVAHDFNNLLTAITGHSELAAMSLKTDDPLLEDIEIIQKAAGRAADLTKQLLAFSRKQALAPKVVDLNSILVYLGGMLKRIIGEDVNLKSISGTDLWKTKVDPSQMEQVIVNLCVNGRDAMPGGGDLIIETSNLELAEDFIGHNPDLKPGRYVVLSVSDTGIGMPENTKARIFEPFFTTKDLGKGTGLGLSTVYGIVKQSDGHVSVYSEVGQGTTFKVYLPAVEGEVEFFESVPEPSEMPRGNETVMVVEDDEIVRDIAVEILKRQGYKVIEAKSGGDAYILCERMEELIDLIVTDVVMPNMSGPQLIQKLRDYWPDIAVLYMSGYTESAIIHQGVLETGISYLQKPFRPMTFALKVREILDRKTSANKKDK